MANQNKDNGNDETSIFDTYKSAAVIAVSGFAGALAGLSIARSRARSHAQAQIANLPIVFAISTATFASIIEYSNILSPTNYILQSLNSQDILDFPIEISNLTERFGWDNRCSTTLGDYAIGGAVAGAIFSGGGGIVNKTIENKFQNPADVKNTNTNMTFSSAAEKQKTLIGKGKVVTLASKKIKRKQNSVDMKGGVPKRVNISKAAPSATPMSKNLGSAALPKPRIMSGLSTGLVLGLAAGVAQISLTKLEEYIRSHSETPGEQDSRQPGWTQEQEDELNARVQTMSTEDIQREIDALKSNMRKQ